MKAATKKVSSTPAATAAKATTSTIGELGAKIAAAKAASDKAAASKPAPKPAEKPASAPTKTEPAHDVPMLKTSHLAKKYGMRTTQLRRILRSMEAYNDGVFTRYAWASWNDPMILKIEARIKHLAAEKVEAAAVAKAAVAVPAKA